MISSRKLCATKPLGAFRNALGMDLLDHDYELMLLLTHSNMRREHDKFKGIVCYKTPRRVRNALGVDLLDHNSE